MSSVPKSVTCKPAWGRGCGREWQQQKCDPERRRETSRGRARTCAQHICALAGHRFVYAMASVTLPALNMSASLPRARETVAA